VPLFSDSLRKTQVNPDKIYLTDPGLASACSFERSGNQGHLFENLVYLDLRRRGFDVWYYRTRKGREVDFFAQDPMGQRALLQVCWDTSSTGTLALEEEALSQAEEELGIKGHIITPENYCNQFLPLLDFV